MNIQGMAIIFSLSFMTAITGAMSPGPLLTYTIMSAIRDKKKGYMVGIWIIAGHAILESAIIIAILLGFSAFLGNVVFVRVISIVGCGCLIFFGVSIFVRAARGKISADFLEGTDTGTDMKSRWLDRPVLGGILVSMSNPYWWIWWVTIGGAFLAQFKITITDWDMLLAFFIGHEAGDLAWYAPVSFLTHFGRKKLDKTVYTIVLVLCGIFMVGFGLYLGIKPFFE
jgi:threonine/homoserine/homoserine lactone efflux protein